MRAFISIDIEESSIRSAIQEIQNELSLNGIRLVNPSLIHLTLKFLGETAESKIDKIAQSLIEIATKTKFFEIPFKGIGVFPNLRRPRVIWVGVEDDNVKTQLRNLANSIDHSMNKFGFPLEKRKFSSHLTIGRIKFTNPALISKLKNSITTYADQPFGNQGVQEIRLKKSTLTPKGPIYEILSVASLAHFPD